MYYLLSVMITTTLKKTLSGCSCGHHGKAIPCTPRPKVVAGYVGRSVKATLILILLSPFKVVLKRKVSN